MPRGSRPGERRGGRSKGTPNKATVAKAAALKAASEDATVTPLQFLLNVMRDSQAPTDLRIKVARVAAPLVDAKPALSGAGARNADRAEKWDGFAIELKEAKAFRDLEDRLARLRRKRYAPSENEGPLTAAQIVEEAKIGSLISDRAAHFVCPADYGPQDAVKDSNRLHQLNCKRLSPPSCGGGELKGADDDEESVLAVRVAAYRYSQEGRDRCRMTELEVYRSYLNPDEEAELARLRSKYPKVPESVEHQSTTGHVDPAQRDWPTTPA